MKKLVWDEGKRAFSSCTEFVATLRNKYAPAIPQPFYLIQGG
jgi:hypothetical protein